MLVGTEPWGAGRDAFLSTDQVSPCIPRDTRVWDGAVPLGRLRHSLPHRLL